MDERPLKLVLDTDTVDKLEADAVSARQLRELIAESKIAILLPRAIQEQLRARSAGLPSWLPFDDVADATRARADVLVSDDRRCRRRARSSGRFERSMTYDELVELLRSHQLPPHL
jgi:hypothetical protein